MIRSQRWEELEKSEKSLEVCRLGCTWLIESENGCRDGGRGGSQFFFPISFFSKYSLCILILEQEEAKRGKVLNGNSCPGVSRGG